MEIIRIANLRAPAGRRTGYLLWVQRPGRDQQTEVLSARPDPVTGRWIVRAASLPPCGFRSLRAAMRFMRQRARWQATCGEWLAQGAAPDEEGVA